MVVVMLMALGVGVLGVVMYAEHWQLQPVLSGSMRPLEQPGDLVVAQATSTATLRMGQIVGFYPPGKHSGAPVMHRIVTLHRAHGVTTITTKGDANPRVDPWGPIRLDSPTTYRLVYVVPKVGFASVWLNRTTGGVARGVLLTVAGVMFLFLGAQSLRRTSRRGKGGDDAARSEPEG